MATARSLADGPFLLGFIPAVAVFLKLFGQLITDLALKIGNLLYDILAHVAVGMGAIVFLHGLFAVKRVGGCGEYKNRRK